MNDVLPLAKAEAGASPGATAFLEDLIDACVMESYFREHMADSTGTSSWRRTVSVTCSAGMHSGA
jgi:hypothetical protein